MLQFKLKERDTQTKVRTGILKSKFGSVPSPQRILTSTELNYRNDIKAVCSNLKYPHDNFFAQIRINAKRLLMKENSYYSSLSKQVERYLPPVVDKNCILKPVLGLYINEKQEDGKYKQKFKPLNSLDLNLSEDKIGLIIKTIIQLAVDTDYDGLSLPYIFKLLRLDLWEKNFKLSQKFALELSSGLEVMPQLPHSDNINDFKMALNTFHDTNKQGLICIPFAGIKTYRFTHNAVKEFSEKDKSEEIGIICTDAPRKHPSRSVAHPHYTLLQGYDFVVREMPYLPFLRENGKGAHELKIEDVKRFERSNLAIQNFDKGILFDTNPVDTSCSYFKGFDNQTLFRKAWKGGYLDTLSKVMESFDSHNEMEECHPFIRKRDFHSYMVEKQSLHNAYRFDFNPNQKGLDDFKYD